MESTLTIKQAAQLLNLSYNTVFAHRKAWGFFQMEGVRGWRVYKSVLDQNRKQEQDISRLYVKVGDNQEKRKCRSEKTSMVSGKLTLPHQQVNAFDVVVKRLTDKKRSTCTTS